MTEPQQQPQPQPQFPKIAGLDIIQIAKLYAQWNWALKMIGVKIPPEAHNALMMLAQGGQPTPETMQNLQTMIQQSEVPEPEIGEPVMTWKLAKDAWLMHQEGMGLREIAESLTRQGNPVSHATVARWINDYEESLQLYRKAKIRTILKILGFIGAIAIALFIGKMFL